MGLESLLSDLVGNIPEVTEFGCGRFIVERMLEGTRVAMICDKCGSASWMRSSNDEIEGCMGFLSGFHKERCKPWLP